MVLSCWERGSGAPPAAASVWVFAVAMSVARNRTVVHEIAAFILDRARSERMEPSESKPNSDLRVRERKLGQRKAVA